MVYGASEAEVLEQQHALETPGWPVLRVRSDESIGRPEDIGKLASPKPQKDARITLNLPPQLYRDLVRWADTTAEALDVPRVSVQQALRGMIREVTSNPAVSAKIMSSVREELS
jgi:hypothetical protein